MRMKNRSRSSASAGSDIGGETRRLLLAGAIPAVVGVAVFAGSALVLPAAVAAVVGLGGMLGAFPLLLLFLGKSKKPGASDS